MFHPTLQQNIVTNIGRKFCRLVIKHFPIGSRLYKIFNPNTLKISYSCMPNIAAIIKQHNATIVRKGQPATKDDTISRKTCNCCVKDQCPLDGACLTWSIVYKTTIQTDNDQRGNTSTSQRRPSSHSSTPTSSQCATRNTSTA